MRTISNEVKAVLDADYGATKDLVQITIQAQINPSFPETTLYVANGEGIIVDGQVYDNKLRSVDTIKFSLGSAPDNAQITLENVSRSLGLTLNDTSRFIDNARVIISKATQIADGTWEPNIIFKGNVKDIKVDQDIVSLTVSSDMNKRGTNVAGTVMTQRCIAVFNKNGSGVGPDCGWITSMPGDALECDHDLDTPNGCKAHGNQQRFRGVPAFTALNASNGYDSNDGGGWGTGPGGGWCVHPDTWILCTNTQGFRYWLQAYKVSDIDILVSMDKFGKAKRTKVKKAIKGTTTQLLIITTESDYSLKCSPSHPIISGFDDEHGKPASTLRIGDRVIVGSLREYNFKTDFIKSIEVLEVNCNVIIFELEEPYHTFIAGSTKDGGILSHNVKPIFTQQGGGYPIEFYQQN